MKCWDEFLTNWTTDRIGSPSQQYKAGLEEQIVEKLRERQCYFLKVSSQSLKLFTHALNIADAMLFNPEYLDKNLGVLALVLVYVLVFKCLNYASLGQPQNLIQREHLMDFRHASPFNHLFMQFIAAMKLELHFDCLTRELRFGELYLSFPLLVDSDFGRLVQTTLQTELLKPVRLANQTYYRDYLTNQHHFGQSIEFDRLLATSDDN